MPPFDIESLRAAQIHLRANAQPPVHFAAQELRRYLQRLTGFDVPIQADAEVGGRTTVVVGATALAGPTPRLHERGTFAIRPHPRWIALFGGSPRALLAAAYALLEQFGCRWSLHGAAEEVVPDLRGSASIELTEVLHTPPFRVSGYCSDIMTWHYTQPEQFRERLPEDRQLIDWMAKSGATTFFYIRHPFDTQLTIPELAEDFAQRGIEVEVGGHVLPLLLPRERFAGEPHLFPQAPSGERVEHGNLCTSSSDALEIVATSAVDYVRGHPETPALHIWGADLWKGGWCHCAACHGVSVQDQSLRVCNRVAQALAAAGLTRPICYLAYHDTLSAELTLRPEPQVVCEWAPRERCYGHALADPGCARNQQYRESLERYVELFAGRVRLFEYYGDSILFFGCALPLVEVIEADMQYYQRLGIREALMLQFGTYSAWAHPLNYLAFAAASTQPTCSAVSLREQYCQRFGAETALAVEMFRDLEVCLGQVVRYGDVRIPPRDPALAATTRAAIEGVTPRLAGFAERLESCVDPWLRSQAQLLRYTETVLTAVAQEIEAPGGIDERLDRAREYVAAVERPYKGLWGAVDLPIIHSFYSAAAHLDL